MIVVDASVVVAALVDHGPGGNWVRGRLRGESLSSPDLVYLEVASVLRRLERQQALNENLVAMALDDLRDLAIRVVPHRAVLGRVWELRDNFTSYDAAYVATAELLDAGLLTADAKLAAAPGSSCPIELAGAERG